MRTTQADERMLHNIRTKRKVECPQCIPRRHWAPVFVCFLEDTEEERYWCPSCGYHFQIPDDQS